MEKRILKKLLANGYSQSQIANYFGVKSKSTVRHYLIKHSLIPNPLITCLYCLDTIGGNNSKFAGTRKFCDVFCQQEYYYELKVQRWLAGKIEGGNNSGVFNFVKKYLIEMRGEKCERCGWCEINEYSGKIPLDVHHTRENTNHRPEYLELLCPNCHSLTPSYKISIKEKEEHIVACPCSSMVEHSTCNAGIPVQVRAGAYAYI